MVKKKNVQAQQKVTIYFGYVLFLLILIALVSSIFSWYELYSFSFMEDANITLMFVSFAFAALAPPLVGYLAGDSATRNKSKLTHHYNGVLFGVLGVWLWAALSLYVTIFQWTYVTQTAFENALVSIVPAGLAAIGTIVLGVLYAKSTRHQVTLIKYTPYRWALFMAVAALILGFGLSAVSGLHYGGSVFMGVLINLIMPLLFILVTGLLGYWILGKKVGTPAERVVYSLVAIGYGFLAGTLVGQLSTVLAGWQGYFPVLVLLVWVGYLCLLRRASH